MMKIKELIQLLQEAGADDDEVIGWANGEDLWVRKSEYDNKVYVGEEND